ncbi:MAG: dihydroorotate dehydrogenase electron transfer subunit [Candidatus Omnitrophota bacterium]
MKATQSKSKILSNLKISGNYFKLQVICPCVAAAARPGQFVMVQVNNGIEPLLRRPLGVHRLPGQKKNIVELLYEVVGRGTGLLSRKKPGESIDIIGPLGNGFDYGPAYGRYRPQVLVAGGMGVAPLTFLAEKLTEGKRQKAKGKIIVLLGAKTKDQILCEKEFKKIGCEVRIATDDGSRGFKGRVTDLLNRELRTTDYAPWTIYACGPGPMLRAISCLSKDRSLPAQLSLEAHMSCGFGACLGCVVSTTGGYKRVCKEGPVFSAEEIIWE